MERKQKKRAKQLKTAQKVAKKLGLQIVPKAESEDEFDLDPLKGTALLARVSRKLPVLRSASPEENANTEAISGGFAQQPGATLTTMPQTISDNIDMFATPGGSLYSTSSAPARPLTLSR
ncbi:hypothetical protein LTR37_021143 [Vermiconidia calcicola]|uniref:Uncharacterized protein n=1 Tax=Vermiconidia calcicola TaxID=1690605 RepID=A0ACC3M9M2_9PEZI|nr:hypothetical protein LTR37_021143 [Vermiconidia calcicola]